MGGSWLPLYTDIVYLIYTFSILSRLWPNLRNILRWSSSGRRYLISQCGEFFVWNRIKLYSLQIEWWIAFTHFSILMNRWAEQNLATRNSFIKLLNEGRYTILNFSLTYFVMFFLAAFDRKVFLSFSVCDSCATLVHSFSASPHCCPIMPCENMKM